MPTSRHAHKKHKHTRIWYLISFSIRMDTQRSRCFHPQAAAPMTGIWAFMHKVYHYNIDSCIPKQSKHDTLRRIFCCNIFNFVLFVFLFFVFCFFPYFLTTLLFLHVPRFILAHVTVAHQMDSEIRMKLYNGNAKSYVNVRAKKRKRKRKRKKEKKKTKQKTHDKYTVLMYANWHTQYHEKSAFFTSVCMFTFN